MPIFAIGTNKMLLFMKPLLLPAVVLLLTATSCTDKRPPAIKEPAHPQPAYITAGDSSGQLMPEMRFWELIEAARRMSAGHYQSEITALQQVLAPLDAGDIARFDNTFTALMAASYDWRLWAAAYVINPKCGEDCFEHFREYLVAQGRERFYATLQAPDNCAAWIKPEQAEGWEGIRYAAAEAYRQKRGKELRGTATPPAFTLKGKPFDSATVRTALPELARKFPAG
jgi:hypothetical protein